MGSGGILTGHDVWSRRADSYVLHWKTNENLQRGRWDPGGIHVGSMWDPHGFRWDPARDQVGSVWDPIKKKKQKWKGNLNGEGGAGKG